MNWQKFAHQPTTIAGLAALCGTAEAVLAGHLTWQQAVAPAVGAIIMIVIPDNTALAQDIEQVAAAAVKAALCEDDLK